MADDLIIRRAAEEDISAIAELERQCFKHPWSEAAIEADVCGNERARFFVAVRDGNLAGYAGSWLVIDEYEIANVAVSPKCRKEGIGSRLIEALISSAESENAHAISLEVRPSNRAALALYKKYGFKEEGLRKGYYDDGEDAVIMWRRQ